MKFGVYNAILHDRSLPEAIEVIAKLGLTGIELNSGGFLPAVHIPTFDDILSSDSARDDFLGQFEGTGVEIAGLNCNGNPLHPDPVIGSKHAEDVRRSIRLANRLGQHRVVTMSGLPAGEPGGKRPNWIVNAWNSAALDVLDYQWSVAEEFWREIDREAADLDVKVALELHPQNIVFNPAGMRELVERTGGTNVGVELDASHLFWQWMDPVAVAQDLGPLVFHAERRTYASILRPLFTVCSTTGSADWGRTRRANLGGDESANEWPKDARGTSSHSVAATTPSSGRPGSLPCTQSIPTCSSTSSRGRFARPHRGPRGRRRGLARCRPAGRYPYVGGR